MNYDFYKRAGLVCQSIPYGRVATYGQIALLCGKPKNARQVGYGLRTGRLGKEMPAHRVVDARGILSGAAAFETADLQKLLLEHEKVPVTYSGGRWQVDLKAYQWRTGLKEAEGFRVLFEEKGI